MNITLEESVSTDNAKVFGYLEMGLKAIPIILEDLQRNTYGWQHFLVLRALTKHTKLDPGNLPNDHKGDLPKIKEFWLNWARQNKFI